jgi:hypothetical protein
VDEHVLAVGLDEVGPGALERLGQTVLGKLDHTAADEPGGLALDLGVEDVLRATADIPFFGCDVDAEAGLVEARLGLDVDRRRG